MSSRGIATLPALEAWRRGDDTAHARAILGELAIDALDDEFEGRA